MRELNQWAKKSRGRDQYRAAYARYISSRSWFDRRDRWAAEELSRIGREELSCWGGCGKLWRVDRDDMHHMTYLRLGDEVHEDLWPLCRSCHNALHRILESSRSWRRLPRELANHHALAIVQAGNSAPGAESSDGTR